MTQTTEPELKNNAYGCEQIARETAEKFIDIHGRYMNLHINDILPEYKELAKEAYVLGFKRGVKEGETENVF